MLGSYTQASAIGLGIATVRPEKRVIVMDGDGSLLGSSILPVTGAAAPENLTIVGLDNGVFGSTGTSRARAATRLTLPSWQQPQVLTRA